MKNDGVTDDKSGEDRRIMVRVRTLVSSTMESTASFSEAVTWSFVPSVWYSWRQADDVLSR